MVAPRKFHLVWLQTLSNDFKPSYSNASNHSKKKDTISFLLHTYAQPWQFFIPKNLTQSLPRTQMFFTNFGAFCIGSITFAGQEGMSFLLKNISKPIYPTPSCFRLNNSFKFCGGYGLETLKLSILKIKL